MTQGFLNQITDTSLESGDDLAERINRFDAATKTGQAGTSRPGGLNAGGTWSRDNEDGTFTRMLYNGVTDAPVSPAVLDEDDFASNSATRPSSQRATAAYITSEIDTALDGVELPPPAAGDVVRHYYPDTIAIPWSYDSWRSVMRWVAPAAGSARFTADLRYSPAAPPTLCRCECR